MYMHWLNGSFFDHTIHNPCQILAKVFEHLNFFFWFSENCNWPTNSRGTPTYWKKPLIWVAAVAISHITGQRQCIRTQFIYTHSLYVSICRTFLFCVNGLFTHLRQTCTAHIGRATHYSDIHQPLPSTINAYCVLRMFYVAHVYISHKLYK